MAYVDEHQVIPDSDKEKLRSDEIPPIIHRIKKYLAYSNTASKNLRETWAENYKFVVLGDQWSLRRPKWRFKDVINVTWANIMTEVGLETDSAPKFDITPTEGTDFEFAKVINEINDINWNKPINRGFGWQSKTVEAVFKRKIFDVVHAKIGWDPDLEDGLGDICYEVLNPFGCYWDPYAKSIYDARWFIYINPVPTEKLKAMYPEMAGKIKPDFSPSNRKSHDYIDKSDIDLDFTANGLQNILNPEKNKRDDFLGANRYGGEPLTLVYEAWLRDEELVEEQEGDEEAPVFVQRKKYPKGHYIKCACNMILDEQGEDGEADPKYPQIFKDGLFPIATLKNYDYGEYAGQNEVDQQKGIQKTLNYTFAHMMDQFTKAASPQKIVHPDEQDIVPMLTDEPGLVIEADPNKVRWETGPGVNPSTFNVIGVCQDVHDRVSGVSRAAGAGIPDPNIQSGDHLDFARTIAQTRTRLKSRTLGDYLNQVGYLCVSRIMEFYTAKRVFRITNKQGYPETIEFYMTPEDEDGLQKAQVSRTTQVPAEDLAPEAQSPVQVTKTLDVKGMPDVVIKAGSNIPFSKKMKEERALQALNLGVITPKSFLEAIDWPNPEKEIQAVMEMQKQKQPEEPQ